MGNDDQGSSTIVMRTLVFKQAYEQGFFTAGARAIVARTKPLVARYFPVLEEADVAKARTLLVAEARGAGSRSGRQQQKA